MVSAYNVRWQIVPWFHGAKVKTICLYPPIAVARFRLMELDVMLSTASIVVRMI